MRAVGTQVTGVAVGDPVLLSYHTCRRCHCCTGGHQSVCVQFNALNFGGPRAVFHEVGAARGAAEPPIGGKFFGQSSFAHYSVVEEQSVVNAKDLVRSEDELRLFAPLGCGIQTGTGTVINVLQAGPENTRAVVGLGGVGLAAVMAAKIQGVAQIIGIDRVATRLDLATELGATHVVNTATLAEQGKDLVAHVRELAGGVGASLVVEATGVPALIKAGLEFTRAGGTLCQVGAAPPDATLSIPIMMHMCEGKIYRGAIEGDCVPQDWIPKMVDWYRQGKLPLERLVQYFPAKDFDKAVHAMLSGETIKPVLLWS